MQGACGMSREDRVEWMESRDFTKQARTHLPVLMVAC